MEGEKKKLPREKVKICLMDLAGAELRRRPRRVRVRWWQARSSRSPLALPREKTRASRSRKLQPPQAPRRARAVSSRSRVYCDCHYNLLPPNLLILPLFLFLISFF